MFEIEIRERRETRWADFTAKAASLELADDYSTADWQSLKTAFGVSNFVFRTFLRNPKLPFAIMAENRLHGALEPDYYKTALQERTADINNEEELSRVLRHFRYKEMGRLAWRDLAGFAELDVMTAELSRLAQACIDVALDWLYPKLAERFGTPMDPEGKPVRPVVLGLGKLGAGELNFSSDIDLIFAFSHNGLTAGGRKETTNKDFFVRLFQRFIKILGDVTADGFVFRVDARLRPFGDTGELALGFDEMETYYERYGREWERYAWIKASPVGGDIAAGNELIRRLTPFIYRRYLDYNAFDSLRQMKRMINEDVARQGMEDNVKLGWGGIREVEFFGQVFQLIRGGVEPYLRAPQIIKVLNILAENGNIPLRAKDELLEAYVFLRKTEHHIQEMDDFQTHDLPVDVVNKLALAQSLGFDTLFEFDSVLYNYRKVVNHHFQLLLAEGDETDCDETMRRLQILWKHPHNIPEVEGFLETLGFDDGAGALKVLADFAEHPNIRNVSARVLERLDKLMPKVITAAAGSQEPVKALDYVVNILLKVANRSNYMSLLIENQAALENLIRLCLASPWIANFLGQHPVLLDELVDSGNLVLSAKPKESLYLKLKKQMDGRPADDEEGRIETMCVFKQTKILRVVAADVLGSMSLMNVSDWLSEIAEACVRAAVNMAWFYLAAKHGEPETSLNGKPCGRGFVVAAYGKLGGLELGYASDLDLVFLHAAAEGYTNGPKPIDNGQFYNRLAQRVVHILTTPTRAGRVYEIDTRLRPSGSSGLLVTHIDGFRDYQLNHAWLWEHQALIKARPVFGEDVMNASFEDIRREVLTMPRNPVELKQGVLEMRAKINEALYTPKDGVFDLKYSPGAMVDIEFLVQYLVLRYGRYVPALLQWTDVVRQIQELNHAKILTDEMAHILKRAYLLYRATGHKLSLQEKPKQVEDDRFGILQQGVEGIWHGVFFAL